MDFAFRLPKDSAGNSGIVVFVDRLSKMAQLAAVPNSIDGEGAAKLFIDRVFRQHGLPVAIVSDRDPHFTGKFWKSIFRVLGTRLDISAADHPQTDGTLATSPDTGIDPHDDVTLKVSPHEIEGSPAHQAAPEGAEISAEAFDALRHEVQLFREVLARFKSSFEASGPSFDAGASAASFRGPAGHPGEDAAICGTTACLGASAFKSTWKGSRYGLSKRT